MSTAGAALFDAVVPAGEPWMGTVNSGQLLRIVDLEGNQAVDTLFYNADDTDEHYSAQDTIQSQGRIYLTTGSVLLSNRGRPMLQIVDSAGVAELAKDPTRILLEVGPGQSLSTMVRQIGDRKTMSLPSNCPICSPT